MSNNHNSLITQDVINQLFASAEKLKAGDYTSAQTILQKMNKSVDELLITTEHYQTQADQQRQQCVSQIQTLEQQIGDLYQQEQQLNQQASNLRAQLSSTEIQEDELEKRLQQLNQQLAAAQSNLHNRQKKLNEVKKWFWVPGYGQYLAIRTLVDDDINKVNSLSNTLRDTQHQLHAKRINFQQIKRLGDDLERASHVADALQTQLTQTRQKLRAQVKAFKDTYEFLANSALFWGTVKQILDKKVEDAVEDLNLIIDELGQELALPAFDDIEQEVHLDMKDALLEFSRTLDSGQNFLVSSVKVPVFEDIDQELANIRKALGNVATIPNHSSQVLAIQHTQQGAQVSHDEKFVNYKTWGGGNWQAQIGSDGQFSHQAQGASSGHSDTIINYQTWNGEEWTATVDPVRQIFKHTRRGASSGHEDVILNYIGWDRSAWTMQMVANQPENLTIPHTQRGASTSHDDLIANYKTWGGDNWTAQIGSNGDFSHQAQGSSSSHLDTIINYQTWGGDDWTATLNPQRKVFKHIRRGASSGHEDTILNYIGWDGSEWTMRIL